MSNSPTLILCVDRDDDIGFKGNIASPVIGRDSCLNAANVLGLMDPEDSDINAIFQALKLYDELSSKGEEVVVAIISGDHHQMLEGDRKIAADLGELVEQTGAEQCLLVTDGAEDEFILPIIQSRIRVDGVQRVIVNQMPNLEGTYYILKKLFDDPKISRQVFVPVGLGMLLYAIAYMLGYPEGAIIIVVGVIGTYLLFKGFGVDEVFTYAFQTLKSSFRGGRITFVAYITSLLLILVGVVMGLTSLMEWYTAEAGLFFYVLSFIYGSVSWFIVASLVASLGKIIDTFLNEPEHLAKVIVLPFFLLAIGIIAYGASVYTLSISGIPDFPFAEDDGIRSIVFSTIGGLGCAFLGIYLQRVINRWLGTYSMATMQNNDA
jgi:putative membrane protein